MTNTGVVTVSGIEGFHDLRRRALLGAHVCSKAASNKKTLMFEDGTSRTTLAAMTRGLSSIQDLELGDVSDPSKCTADFKEAVAKFRETVADGEFAF